MFKKIIFYNYKLENLFIYYNFFISAVTYLDTIGAEKTPVKS